MVDVLAVTALLVGLIVGLTRGLVATAGTLVGLVVGTIAAVWAVPLMAPGVADWEYRSLVLTLAALAIVALGIAAGTGIGVAVRRGVEKARLRVVDRLLGGVVNLVATGALVLLVSGAVTASGMPVIATAVGSSRVVGALDDATPPFVDDALSQMRGFVIDEGIPRVEELLAPEVEPTTPTISLDDPELEVAAQSVARITGTAYACSVSMTGSGFVVAPELVVTNAHVVAGVDNPIVEVPGEEPREGRLIAFDPEDDLAVIAVDGLEAEPLAVVDPVEPGTSVAVQGYPLGGPFRSEAGTVLSVGVAPVPNIYDDATSAREIYALQANVQPGNSGGPVLTENGEVTGVVFARGIDDDRRGYAMTSDEIDAIMAGVTTSADTVASGACSAG